MKYFLIFHIVIMEEKKTNDSKKETKEPVKKTAEKKVAETKTETEPKFKNVKKESKGTVKVEKKEKHSGAKTCLEVILSIVLIVIVLFIAHGIRNYITVYALKTRFADYENSTNYSVHSTSTSENEDTKLTIDFYRKNNRQVTFITREKAGQTVNISEYKNGSRVDTFWDTSAGEKKAKLNQNLGIATVNISTPLYPETKFIMFMTGMFETIHEEDYNGMRVYAIKYFFDGNDTTYYIEKQTGLLVKTTYKNDSLNSYERQYEFDKVDNSIFLEPDISEYEVEE